MQDTGAHTGAFSWDLALGVYMYFISMKKLQFPADIKCPVLKITTITDETRLENQKSQVKP